MPENPYQTPATEPDPVAPPDYTNSVLSAPSITLLVVAWITWVIFLPSYVVDFGVVALNLNSAESADQYSGSAPEPESGPNYTLVGMLGLSSCFAIGFVFLFRWLFFRVFINPKRAKPGSWAAAVVGFFGMLVVYGIIKSIEFYGLTLTFMSSIPFYHIIFAIPSILLMIAHIPVLMLDKRVVRRLAD